MPLLKPCVLNHRGFISLTLSTALLTSLIVTPQRQAAAQSLPPLYDDDPVALVAERQIAAFPVNTFLESIVIAPDGTLFITNHEEGKVLHLTSDGELLNEVNISGKAAGLALTQDGKLLLTAWNAENVPTVFQIDADGTVTTLLTIPEAAFLNGLTQLEGDRYLIADSYRGAIWELDVSEKSARIWLEDPLLARRTAESVTPGVNGLKIFNGVVYASNSDQAHIVRIPIEADGAAGEPELFVESTQIDDFAFDTEGNLYGATHVFNSVIRVAPDGATTTIAQNTVGSTAIAFGRTEQDQTSIYVVTNGGMFLPPPTGVVPAEVVRLEVGNRGLIPNP